MTNTDAVTALIAAARAQASHLRKEAELADDRGAKVLEDQADHWDQLASQAEVKNKPQAP